MTNSTEAANFIDHALRRMDEGHYERAALCGQIAQAYALLGIVVDWLAELAARLDALTCDTWDKDSPMNEIKAIRTVQIQ